MKGGSYASLATKAVVCHTVTYFLVGAAAYFLLTKDLYAGPDAPFRTFMRTEDEPELWSHVMTWFLPGQILRGLLMSVVLLPLLDTLLEWSWRRRALVIAGLYLGFGFWGATVAAPGTIEGLIYLRPEITYGIHLEVQPEIVLQGLAFAVWLAVWLERGFSRPSEGSTVHPPGQSSLLGPECRTPSGRRPQPPISNVKVAQLDS